MKNDNQTITSHTGGVNHDTPAWLLEAAAVLAENGLLPILPLRLPAGALGTVGCAAVGETCPWPPPEDLEGGHGGGYTLYRPDGEDDEDGSPARMTWWNSLSGREGNWRSLRSGERDRSGAPITRRLRDMYTLDDGAVVAIIDTERRGGRERVTERVLRHDLIEIKGVLQTAGLEPMAPLEYDMNPFSWLTPKLCRLVGQGTHSGTEEVQGWFLLFPPDASPEGDTAPMLAWWNAATHKCGLWQGEGRHLTTDGMREWANRLSEDPDGRVGMGSDDESSMLADLLYAEVARMEGGGGGQPISTKEATEAAQAEKAARLAAQLKLAMEDRKRRQAGSGRHVPSTPVAVGLDDFLSHDFPPRGHLLTPIIPEQGLVMMYAPRGSGKTFMSLSIALAVASGGTALRWEAPGPRGVLYIDGEMPGALLQERLRQLLAGVDKKPTTGSLRIVSPDMVQDGLLPNLARLEGQAAVAPLLEGADLVVVDNLATLARGAGKDNETESWHPIQDWLLAQRRAGRSVLLVHHAGKGGDQRGSSAKEDVLDTTLKLSRPKDYNPEQGARFIVEITKGRGISGQAARPFEATLVTLAGDGLGWATNDVSDVRAEQARELKALNMSIRDISDELGIPKSTVARLLAKPPAPPAWRGAVGDGVDEIDF